MPDQMYDQVKQLADLNAPPVKKSSGFVTLFVILIFLAGVGVAGYATYDWWRTNKPVVQIMEPTPTPISSAASPTLAPSSTSISPTSAPTSTSMSLKIQILNGTGVPGVAGKVKDMLTTAGYTSVSTGNAQAYEYDSTVIMAKPSAQSSVLALQTLLAKTYTMDNQKNNLDTSNPYDIVIIVGKK